MVDTFVRAFEYGVSPLQMLANLRSADEYTFTHVVNVCILTMSQAEALGFRGNGLYEIGMALALHDAGKLLIPQEILNKPGALTPQERSIMETHTIQGANYVLGLKNVPKPSVLAALEHHLKFDGSGYPVISKGWQPHIVSQMIAISDVFDALRSRRCYREPAPMERIVEILKSEEEGRSTGLYGSPLPFLRELGHNHSELFQILEVFAEHAEQDAVIDIRIAVHESVPQAGGPCEPLGQSGREEAVFHQNEGNLPKLMGLSQALGRHDVVPGVQHGFQGKTQEMLGQSLIRLGCQVFLSGLGGQGFELPQGLAKLAQPRGYDLAVNQGSVPP